MKAARGTLAARRPAAPFRGAWARQKRGLQPGNRASVFCGTSKLAPQVWHGKLGTVEDGTRAPLLRLGECVRHDRRDLRAVLGVDRGDPGPGVARGVDRRAL